MLYTVSTRRRKIRIAKEFSIIAGSLGASGEVDYNKKIVFSDEEEGGDSGASSDNRQQQQQQQERKQQQRSYTSANNADNTNHNNRRNLSNKENFDKVQKFCSSHRTSLIDRQRVMVRYVGENIK